MLIKYISLAHQNGKPTLFIRFDMLIKATRQLIAALSENNRKDLLGCAPEAPHCPADLYVYFGKYPNLANVGFYDHESAAFIITGRRKILFAITVLMKQYSNDSVMFANLKSYQSYLENLPEEKYIPPPKSEEFNQYQKKPESEQGSFEKSTHPVYCVIKDSQEYVFKENVNGRSISEIEAFNSDCYGLLLNDRHSEVSSVHYPDGTRAGVVSKMIPNFRSFIQYCKTKNSQEGFCLDEIKNFEMMKIWVAAYVEEENDLHLGNYGLNENNLAVKIDDDRATWPLTANYINPLFREEFGSSNSEPELKFPVTARDIENCPILTDAKPNKWVKIGKVDVSVLDYQKYYMFLKRILMPDSAYIEAGKARLCSEKKIGKYSERKMRKTFELKRVLIHRPAFREYVKKNPDVIHQIRQECKENIYLSEKLDAIQEEYNKIQAICEKSIELSELSQIPSVDWQEKLWQPWYVWVRVQPKLTQDKFDCWQYTITQRIMEDSHFCKFLQADLQFGFYLASKYSEQLIQFMQSPQQHYLQKDWRSWLSTQTFFVSKSKQDFLKDSVECHNFLVSIQLTVDQVHLIITHYQQKLGIVIYVNGFTEWGRKRRAQLMQESKNVDDDMNLSKKDCVTEIYEIQRNLRNKQEDERVGYIFTNGHYHAGGHFEVLIITKDQIIKPVDWGVLATSALEIFDIRELISLPYFYIVMNSVWRSVLPQSEYHGCATLGLLYLKELLKENATQLYQDCLILPSPNAMSLFSYKLKFQFIFKSSLSDNSQRQFIFIPSPQALRYSQSEKYNECLFELIKKTLENIDHTHPLHYCVFRWLVQYDAFSKKRDIMNVSVSGSEKQYNSYLAYRSLRNQKIALFRSEDETMEQNNAVTRTSSFKN